MIGSAGPVEGMTVSRTRGSTCIFQIRAAGAGALETVTVVQVSGPGQEVNTALAAGLARTAEPHRLARSKNPALHNHAHGSHEEKVC